jgi:hypothetical protein
MTRRMTVRMALRGSAAVLGLTVATAMTPTAASAAPNSAYNCTGGNISPGTYSSMIISGICYMPAGNLFIRGNLSVKPGDLLDAVTPGDPASSPVVPATVVIGGNVRVGNGAVLVLGCSPNISCPNGVTYDHIRGNLTAIGALGVVVHSATIGGNVSVIGGGGGAAGGPGSGGCFSVPVPKPWSEDTGLVKSGATPQYTDFEDNSIGGNLSVISVQTCWLGSLRNLVGGNATFRADETSDPDGMEVDNNLVARNMACSGNDPKVQFGDSNAAPNLVGRYASGECGLYVLLPNPAPEAGEGTGINEHIAVSTRSLGSYSGTQTVVTSGVTTNVGTTTSGDKLTAITGRTADLAGGGLTGTALAEQELVTTYPDGASKFTAIDTCTTACTFDSKSGANVQLRFYGTTVNGRTFGIFLVVTGGLVYDQTTSKALSLGGLATLAGWGTFTSDHEPTGTLCLSEHLRIT